MDPDHASGGQDFQPWKRLSVRDGRAKDDEPYDGVPPHLGADLEIWLWATCQFGPRRLVSHAFVASLASSARVRLDANDGGPMLTQLLEACHYDEAVFLDVIDAALHHATSADHAGLGAALRNANSIWTVNRAGNGLERRIDPTAVAAKNLATTPADLASAELNEAWANAYSRTPDASDAWDHSIKAMESVLVPLVVPNQKDPTIGHVLGQLRNQGTKWRLVLPGPGGAHDVTPLVSILDLAWPNSDRHANQNSRTPSLEEAQALVHLAVTVVQWVRSGVLQKIP